MLMQMKIYVLVWPECEYGPNVTYLVDGDTLKILDAKMSIVLSSVISIQHCLCFNTVRKEKKTAILSNDEC